MAIDGTYQPKTYRKAGGDEFVIADGGLITVQSGGTVAIETGGDLTYNGDSLIDEIAALSGLDSGELGVLNGNTAGTVTAGKAIVPTTNKYVDELRIGTFYIGTGSNNAAVGTTAAELNTLASTTAGTAAAGKAVVLTTNKYVDELRIGSFYVGAGSNNAQVTASATELNTLTSVTAGTVTAGKAIVSGSSNGLLNDVRAEVFYIGAGSNNAQVTASAPELNKLTGVTGGTVTAGLAVVTTTNKYLDELRIGSVYIGAGTDNAQVTATAAILNNALASTASASKFVGGSYTTNTTDAGANSLAIVTGLASITGHSIIVYDTNNKQVTSDAVITVAGGTITVADGSTYNTVDGQIVKWLAFGA